jgi:hypothetical protein
MSQTPADPQHGVIRAQLSRLERLIGSPLDPEHLPAWLRQTRGEHRIPVALAIVALIVLQLVIKSDLAFEPKFLMPGLEFALLVVLFLANPVRITRESTVLRALGIALVAVASVATIWSAGRLAGGLIRGTIGKDPIAVLLNAAAVWFTIVIVAALWYWEMDRGGPAARANARSPYPDFLFPQMTVPELAKPDWEPAFVDYLYLSFTNTTAFSPTDVMPLSRWAKLAMAIQSGSALVLVALVIARAVNTLQ